MAFLLSEPWLSGRGYSVVAAVTRYCKLAYCLAVVLPFGVIAQANALYAQLP
ncbi:hypothetical protein ACUHMQ_07105 [Chitinimonas sp. PSY-7]|uniref:hypothetical protein n=1 Tax=Chitinimonas sp. PSY-7 TaxID=3459088 RepID=UPI00403FFFEC